jgi:hypothetical protein
MTGRAARVSRASKQNEKSSALDGTAALLITLRA